MMTDTVVLFCSFFLLLFFIFCPLFQWITLFRILFLFMYSGLSVSLCEFFLVVVLDVKFIVYLIVTFHKFD